MNQPIRCYYKENGVLRQFSADQYHTYDSAISAVKNALKAERVPYDVRRRVLAVVNA